MSFINSQQNVGSLSYDEGLRRYMLQVFNLMFFGVALTGFVSMFAATSPAIMALMYNNTGLSGFGWLVTFSPLILSFVFSMGINKMSVMNAQMLFWLFAGVMGLSLSFIFKVYTGESIARVFFITSSIFGSMSIYGYATKRDLTSMGSFMIMGLFGVIIASIVNMFLQSSGLNFALSVVSVLVFTGLTAYDTQKIKNIYQYSANGSSEIMAKSAIIAALSLYMDFINLFLSMLRLFGGRRN